MASLLDRFPGEFAPLANAARRLLDRPGHLSADGILSLGHRPWVATENYTITLYPGLPEDSLERYCDRFKLVVPAMYAEFLATTSGAFCYGMSLAGVPLSMMGNPPLLDRSRLQCHDLATAAHLWSTEYRKVPDNAFHFGGRYFSDRENVGYFLVDGRILCQRKSGKVVGEWERFHDFLRDELPTSEELDARRRPAPPSA